MGCKRFYFNPFSLYKNISFQVYKDLDISRVTDMNEIPISVKKIFWAEIFQEDLEHLEFYVVRKPIIVFPEDTSVVSIEPENIKHILNEQFVVTLISSEWAEDDETIRELTYTIHMLSMKELLEENQ